MPRHKRLPDPVRRLIASRAREMRRQPSPAEMKLWLHLRGDRLLGLRFRRQHAIGPYVADTACPSLKLVIELDGDSHYESPEQEKYDLQRTAYLQRYGWRVTRYTNDDIFTNIDGVLTHLHDLCESLLRRDR